MTRRATIVIFISAIPTLAAAGSLEQDFARHKDYPCARMIQDTRDTKELAAEEATYRYVGKFDGFGGHTSFCSVVEMVRAECRLGEARTIGEAVQSLFTKKVSLLPLPTPRACGA